MAKNRDDHRNVEDEKIGFRHPPRKNRIKPGEVRNPDGRRGKIRSKKDFLDERIEICLDGKYLKVTRAEALDLALFQEATKGNVSAVKELKRQQRERKLSTSDSATQNALQPDDQKSLDRYIQRRLKELEAGQSTVFDVSPKIAPGGKR